MQVKPAVELLLQAVFVQQPPPATVSFALSSAAELLMPHHHQPTASRTPTWFYTVILQPPSRRSCMTLQLRPPANEHSVPSSIQNAIQISQSSEARLGQTLGMVYSFSPTRGPRPFALTVKVSIATETSPSAVLR
jgi:hypothetical protein